MKPHFETPDDIRRQIWKELGRATQDRHHAWRTPVLATAAPGAEVNARTVVLRSVDADLGTLVAFTDQRSAKVAELGQQPSALFVFWSSRLSWQLRVRVNMVVRTRGPEVDAVWERVKQSASAADYLSPVAPGTPQTEPAVASEEPSLHSHFAVLTAEVVEMDWLELGRGGHRRARVWPDAWEWLTP